MNPACAAVGSNALLDGSTAQDGTPHIDISRVAYRCHDFNLLP
jgi:hypothetical protein